MGVVGRWWVGACGRSPPRPHCDRCRLLRLRLRLRLHLRQGACGWKVVVRVGVGWMGSGAEDAEAARRANAERGKSVRRSLPRAQHHWRPSPLSPSSLCTVLEILRPGRPPLLLRQRCVDARTGTASGNTTHPLLLSLPDRTWVGLGLLRLGRCLPLLLLLRQRYVDRCLVHQRQPALPTDAVKHAPPDPPPRTWVGLGLLRLGRCLTLLLRQGYVDRWVVQQRQPVLPARLVQGADGLVQPARDSGRGRNLYLYLYLLPILGNGDEERSGSSNRDRPCCQRALRREQTVSCSQPETLGGEGGYISD
jgi:hypothetical protein